MFHTTILEVALGLVFVYLTLALVCTAIGELVNSVLGLRAKTLHHAIGVMLETPELQRAFYAHPLIRSLASDAKALPSYIPTETFARVLVDLASQAPGTRYDSVDELRQALSQLPELPRGAVLTMLDDTVRSVDEAKQEIGAWFDQVMSRAKGWYVRRIQFYSLVAAALISIGLDADTLQIARATWVDDELRQGLVARAELAAAQASEDGDADSVATLQAGVDEIRAAGLPLGWTPEEVCATFAIACDHGARPPVSELLINLFSKLIGLTATALAVSLGAPFWFDLLSRVVSARAAAAGGTSSRPIRRTPKAA